MAISVRFADEPTSHEKYDAVLKRLQDAGDWPPPGLIFHAAQGDSDMEEVFEVWESREDFERFGSKLMPLLDEVGINAGEPQVREVYNMEKP